MMKSNPQPGKSRILSCIAIGATVFSIATLAKATPYATELKNVSGTVSFTLNESADSVRIVWGITSTNLGALAKGSYSTNVGATSPFSIEVTKSSAAGYRSQTSPGIAGKIQISTDPSTAKFITPRGLAVNKNPASAFFGRVYVANSTPGSNATTARIVGRGLYTLKADLTDSPNGFGTNQQTGGLLFAGSPGGPAASANSPFKLSVGQDDLVYISDYSDANGNLYRVDGNLANGQWVFDYRGGPPTITAPTNHGSVIKAIAEGSLANNNLRIYSLDEDYGSVLNNDLWRYDINGGPLTNQSTPINISSALNGGSSIVQDFCKGGVSNYFYLMQNRPAPASSPAIFVVDTNGNTITNSQDVWRGITGNPSDTDLLTNLQAIAISPDGKYLACTMQGTVQGQLTTIIPLDTNGIPDLANRALLSSGTINQGRAVEFDAAGNLYTASSGDLVVRSFSPGGFTVATTTSDGSFSVTSPATQVSVTATTPTASQDGTQGVFTLTRVGDTSNPLTVKYTLTGTATNGVHYSLISTNATIPAAASSVAVNISPLVLPAGPTRIVTLGLLGGTNYNTATPSSASVIIIDTNTPTVFITAINNQMYERTNDFARFRVTRWGFTNIDVTANILYSGGSAVEGTDFYADAASYTLPAGTTTTTFKVYPIHNGLMTGPLSANATVDTGTGYVAGTPASTSITIVDSDLPPETVLWSDDFNTDTSANWTRFFATTNGAPDDFNVNQIPQTQGEGVWPYNYSSPLQIPPAPHSADGTTLGLYMTVNKNDAITASAALNCYPTGLSFSGNYALRFDMFLTKNTTSGQTEYAIFGINHSSTKTNWFRSSTTGYSGVDATGWSFDGIFYGLEADGAALGDYAAYSSPTTAGRNPTPLTPGRNASTLEQVFKSPPWTSTAGSGGTPANVYGSTTPIWADVEISQINGIITWKINQTVIFSYTNATPYTSGNIMLGYCDSFDSKGIDGGSVIYDNVRVVSLANPVITSIQTDATDAKIFFSANAGDTVDQFVLQSATLVTGPYVDVSSTKTLLSPGNFRFNRALNGAVQFYRIRRTY